MKRILKGYLEKAGRDGVTLEEHIDEIEDTLYADRVILEEPGSHPIGYDKVRVLIEVTRSQKNRRKRKTAKQHHQPVIKTNRRSGNVE